jgi:hypothetical protein
MENAVSTVDFLSHIISTGLNLEVLRPTACCFGNRTYFSVTKFKAYSNVYIFPHIIDNSATIIRLLDESSSRIPNQVVVTEDLLPTAGGKNTNCYFACGTLCVIASAFLLAEAITKLAA